jgi:hypothetical protein
MNETQQPPGPPAPSYRMLETIAEYNTAFDDLLGGARHEIWLFDMALQSSFDRSARADLLRGFLAGNPNARLRILLHDAASVPAHCPRLCGLLRRFSDAVGIHQTTDAARAAADPLLVVDARHALRRVHHASSRSVLITDDTAAVRPLHGRLAQIYEASEPGLTATVLGL